MKKIIILSITFLIASSVIFAQSKAGKTDTLQRSTYYYTCPMHPDYMTDKAGSCPVCGMKLNLSLKEEMKAGVTKNYTCPVHLDMTSHNPGKCPQCGRKMNLSPKEQMKAEVTRIYTCPMHPDVALDKDGVCPKCGAALVEKKHSK